MISAGNKPSGLRRRAGHDPRAAALLAVGEVLNTHSPSQAVLDTILNVQQMPPVDKALCTDLFYGLLRRHLRLAWFTRQKLPRPGALPPELLLLLELSLYSLAHTRLPAHAVVNWAVNLASHRFSPGLGKLVNGFLRGALRGLQTEYLNPDFYAQSLGASLQSPEVISLLHAAPIWLVKLWQKAYGERACLDFLAAGQETPPQGLRLNPAAPGVREMQRELAPYTLLSPHCVCLPAGSRLPLRIWQKQGMVSLQSPAAYAALFEMNPETWPLPVWDACAGQGGKTLALLEQGIPVHSAGDPHKGRLQRLEDEFRRLGLTAGCALPHLFPFKAEESAFRQEFASILLDVPCSGLGTLARRPEVRWRRTLQDLDQIRLTQAKLLETAHEALIPQSGSRILYLTCTLNPAENQDQVRNFLHGHTMYRLDKEYQTPPDSPMKEFFYGAVLLREGEKS